MTDFEPIGWAMQQTGMTVADVVAIILTNGKPKTGRPPKSATGPTQVERVVEFVNSEFDVRAADVVARGITPNTARASTLLHTAWRAGSIDRLGYGLYGPKGTAQ